jgi:DNA-binding NtrC family response regulator
VYKLVPLEDLHEAVRSGAFREDLYYRLNVIVIKLPPLRERTEDISLLVDHFTRKYCEENRRDLCQVDSAAMKVLMDYDWPGNVRELENVIERAVVLTAGNVLTSDLFPKHIVTALPADPLRFPGEGLSLKERVGNFEKALILAALERSDWNQKRAAQFLSVNATTLNEYRKMAIQMLFAERTHICSVVLQTITASCRA